MPAKKAVLTYTLSNYHKKISVTVVFLLNVTSDEGVALPNAVPLVDVYQAA